MSGAASHHSAGDAELSRLLDSAIARLAATRRTFTEAQVLGDVWNAGYEVTPADDPRFARVTEGDPKHHAQWRLTTHILANNRLLDMLHAGAWDGRDLDAQLAVLDAEDGVHYVFCPDDARVAVLPDGTLEPADREPDVPLPPAVREVLGALEGPLLDRWRTAGATPWTARQVTEALQSLGWAGASDPRGWLYVKSWLRQYQAVARAGRDYWVPADALPHEPAATRLQVLPQFMPPTDATAEQPALADSTGQQDAGMAMPASQWPATPDDELVPVDGSPAAPSARWTATLRTANLVGGFLPVPRQVRAVYPLLGAGAGRWEALRGKWFDTGDDLWLWLDRDENRLCGPDLADKLAWCSAGERVRIQWEPDVIVLRTAGVDSEVQREEARLVDVEVLAELRGGLGESYRRSLQAILADSAAGLTFPEVVVALRARQQHEVHRGTVRALLHAGGFVQRGGRWFVAPDPAGSARQLRAVMVESLVSAEEAEVLNRPPSDPKRLRIIAQAIQNRLRELVTALRGVDS